MSQPNSSLERLTARQRDVLELVAKGLTNEDIAGVLGIGIATVKTHLAGCLTVLDVTNRTEAAAVFHAESVRVEQVEVILDRPAIAVLPFVAFDDSPGVAARGLALAHDLGSLFARACWFPVISQLSADRGRSLGATATAIGHALGARFLVDGGVRIAGQRWRVIARVDDVESGHTLWTDHFDFDAGADLFDTLDLICATIVATTYPILIERAGHALMRGRGQTRDVTAWDAVHQGMALCREREEATSRLADARFHVALERDPELALAHFGLGLSAFDAVLNQWGPIEPARARLLDAATRCIAIAPHAGEGYFLQARWCQTLGDHARAVPALEAAISHNPSFAPAHALLAQTLHNVGRSDEGLARMRHASRLGPRAFVAGLSLLHFMRDELEDALTSAEAAIMAAPRYTFARVLAAVSAHLLGDDARCDEHLRRLKADYPPFDVALWRRIFGPDIAAVRRISQTLETLGISA